LIPATTPTYQIELSDSTLLDNITDIRVDFKQGKNIVQKFLSNGDLTVENATISVSLTQEESAVFDKGQLKIQAHGLDSYGTAWKTYVRNVRVDETLTKDVISGSSSGSDDTSSDDTSDETTDTTGTSTGTDGSSSGSTDTSSTGDTTDTTTDTSSGTDAGDGSDASSGSTDSDSTGSDSDTSSEGGTE